MGRRAARAELRGNLRGVEESEKEALKPHAAPDIVGKIGQRAASFHKIGVPESYHAGVGGAKNFLIKIW
jgi:hypothetical protein